MSPDSPNFPSRGLPVGPPKFSLPPTVPKLNQPNPKSLDTGVPHPPQATHPINHAPAPTIEDAYVDESIFNDAPRVLTVNEQPFFRWFKRVFLALIVMTIFIAGVTLYFKATWEIAVITTAVAWAIVLLFALPDAIMPYKKTQIDLTAKTVKVGRKKPQPLSDLHVALLDARGRNIRVWLGFNKQQGFWVPLKSSKFRMKHEDLLALRATIPSTDIAENVELVEVNRKVKNTPISKTQLSQYIESLIN